MGQQELAVQSLFKVAREDLILLVHPAKNQRQLEILGGCENLLKSLCVDSNIGIKTKIFDVSDTVRNSRAAQKKNEIEIVISSKVNASGTEVTEEDRKHAFGENKLPPIRQNNLFDYMLAALSDKIMILLSSVSVISLALGLYEDFGPQSNSTQPRVHWVEGFSILIAADLQKEKKFRKLNSVKEDRYVKAIRNGETQLISIYVILVGDILLLEPGDVLAADGILVSGMGLTCDESSATGESDTIKKSPKHDAILLSGSQVTEGTGKYLVTSVGPNSFFGKIMMGMRTEMEDTPLQVKLDGLAERIAKFGAAGAIFMFIVLLIKYIVQVMNTTGFGSGANQENGTSVASQVLKIIMQSVAIIAIAVPEGLPLAVTLALAYATTRMMKDNCLVRVISACETMGNATTICSDKTGTLTQNRMTVVAGVIGKNVSFEGPEEIRILNDRLKNISVEPAHDPKTEILNSKFKVFGLNGVNLLERIIEGISFNCSVFETKDSLNRPAIIGSKTETALVEWAINLGFKYKEIRSSNEIQLVQMLPFSSERKMMASIIRISNPGYPIIYRIHVKGAPEVILKSCDRIALLPFSPCSGVKYTENDCASSGETTSIDHVESRIPTAGSRSNPSLPLIHPLDSKLRKFCMSKIESFAEKSLRTICLAFRDFSELEFKTLLSGELLKKVQEIKLQEQLAKEIQSKNALIVEIPAVLSISQISQEISETKSFPSLPRSQKEEDDEIADSDILSFSFAFTDFFGVKLICAAIVGIEDPIRPGVAEAVKKCQDAGVSVKMVTGDNIMTAISIAKKCGIYQKDKLGIVMEGARFRQLSKEDRELILPRLQVLARSSPIDKQLLVSSLKAMGETVAVTGDGTNDGPALKLADIGFSMGIAGTEVAKEASSIILMDDSFSSVVSAIIWGRSVNDSVKKFLQFQLSVNVSAMIITLISSILDSTESSVLTVVQLLWVNLIIDTLAALSLGTENPLPDVLNRKPESRKSSLINLTMWKMILGQAVLQVVVNLSLLFGGAQFFGFQELVNEGGVLAINSSSASVQAINERVLLRTITIIIQFGGVTFETTPLNGMQWLFCVLVGFTSIPWGVILRLVRLFSFKVFMH
ncbi:hypothetical protein HK100_001915 [Physocladia obscura]|uniref:Calcium-transporting ATPase 2 n=1 Tax=Physocladia obscura TaxID=109957 RepID=A0AAD5T913_9FUNG|nr:hypothetical protein HK100_001915 [Physocladia obscura]